MNKKITIIGCGIIGATIAYELSQIPGLEITVLDKQEPAQESTGAALGVLMGVISKKAKGKIWKIRENSVRRYANLIPELETIINRPIPVNHQGILKICLDEDNLEEWESLVKIRKQQGWILEMWNLDKLGDKCPQINLENIRAAVYAPQDIQVNPKVLTLALIDAAKQRGVNFQFDANVLTIHPDKKLNANNYTWQIATSKETLETDWLIMTAGNGTTPIISDYAPKIDIAGVLGQALHLRLPSCLGDPDFQPVITGDDVHIVPDKTDEQNITEYWVGATVEYPKDDGSLVADLQELEIVKQKSIDFCPALAQGVTLRQWSGLRPRPNGQPAPIIGKIPEFDHILIATGHYRNGVLLAPGTAQIITKLITGKGQGDKGKKYS